MALFFGGALFSPPYADNHLEIYYANNDTWATPKTLGSTGRARVAGVSLGKYAYFAGGRTNDSSSVPLDTMYRYDTETGEHTVITLPAPFGNAAAGALGKYLVFAGGYDEAGWTDQVYVYDTELDQWSNHTLLNVIYNTPVIMTIPDCALLVFGGSIGQPPQHVLDVFALDKCKDKFGGASPATTAGSGGLGTTGAANSGASSGNSASTTGAQVDTGAGMREGAATLLALLLATAALLV